MTRKKYCGTAAKAGGNGENKPRPKVMGVPCLLEKFLTASRAVGTEAPYGKPAYC